MSNESNLHFQNATVPCIRDSFQGIGCIEEKEASRAGNLTIIYDDDSMPTNSATVSTQPSQVTPLEFKASNKVSIKEIRILLIGRTGHGKSSVVNSLLGRTAFPVSSRSQPCISTFTSEETTRDNVRVVAVDTPGILDTLETTPTLTKELINALLYTTPGFHVIAFVLKPVRFTKVMQETQQLFCELFGENVKSYSCLICTHCSSEADVARYIKDPHPSLKALIDACGGSALPFDNTATADIREKQVRHFLQHVTHIQNKNGGKCYSKVTFNIGNANKQNDLKTIPNESNVHLQNATAPLIRDSVQGIECMKENEASTVGNLNIICDDPSMLRDLTNASSMITPIPENEVEYELLSATIVAPTTAKQIKRSTGTDRVLFTDLESVAPTTAKQVKRSTRAGRVFVHDSESVAPTAAKQIKCSTNVWSSYDVFVTHLGIIFVCIAVILMYCLY